MNKQHVSLLIMLDLSAAFDTIDHTVLLHRLETTFGVTGSSLKWISSYLHDRSQRVVIDDKLSDRCPLPFGIPQGSCLGPLLFSIFASKLFDVIKDHLPSAHAYADDTQLYLSFKPDKSTSEHEAWKAMEHCITAVRAWMITDKLKLNESKTEFMIIGTKHQLNKVNSHGISTGGIRLILCFHYEPEEFEFILIVEQVIRKG